MTTHIQVTPPPGRESPSGEVIDTANAITCGTDPADARDNLRGFAYFPLHRHDVFIADLSERRRQAWADTLTSLARLAEDEDWVGRGNLPRPLPILDTYLRYTYRRLSLEHKIAISADEEYAAFNTGLLTPYAEDIFAVFHKNDPGYQPWVFRRWAPESDPLLLRTFPELPQLAEYVTSPADLVYDWRRPLQLDHEMLAHKAERFPADLAAEPARARRALERSADKAVKRIRHNHKIAVPQWHPALGAGSAQLLLPLELTGNGHADLALVTLAEGSTAYVGLTVMTLEESYPCARLVARPNIDWLPPAAAPMPSVDAAFAANRQQS